MNKVRRKAIAELADKLAELQEQAEDIKADLEAISADEQDAFDHLPESLQESERGEIMQACIEKLEDACGYAESMTDGIDGLYNCLDELIDG